MTDSDPTPRFTVRVDGQDWEQATSLSQAAPADRVFVIDDATGRVMFGDGTHGQRPSDGAVVTVSYREGDSAEGDPAVSITTRWPPEDRRYFISLSSAGIRIGTVGAGAERFAGAKRVAYFAGQRLDASDFRAEQQYLIERRYLHNRALHGFGIVSGLSVTVVDDGPSPSMMVDAGLALDRHGREVELDAPVTLAIGNAPSPQYVIVDYVEREVDPVPTSADDGGTVASRVEEGASIRLSHEAVTDEGIVIARLLLDSTGWEVDSAFEPARCNRSPP